MIATAAAAVSRRRPSSSSSVRRATSWARKPSPPSAITVGSRVPTSSFASNLRDGRAAECTCAQSTPAPRVCPRGVPGVGDAASRNRGDPGRGLSFGAIFDDGRSPFDSTRGKGHHHANDEAIELRVSTVAGRAAAGRCCALLGSLSRGCGAQLARGRGGPAGGDRAAFAAAPGLHAGAPGGDHRAAGSAASPSACRTSCAQHVAHDMRELGLEVDRDPSYGHDLTVHLSVSVQAVGQLSRARAAMYVIARRAAAGADRFRRDHRGAGSPGERAGARSGRAAGAIRRAPAEYADSLYGRRLRPLRDTVGRHAFGRGARRRHASATRRWTWPQVRRLRPDAARACRAGAAGRGADAECASPRATTSCTARRCWTQGRPREAYLAFEQAYLLDDNAESLFGLAESLLRAGARQDALIFYRAYLQQAEPGSPLAARAVAQVSAIEAAPQPASRSPRGRA